MYIEPYETMYHILFNAITDALADLNEGELLHSRKLLKEAQQKAEAFYLEHAQ